GFLIVRDFLVVVRVSTMEYWCGMDQAATLVGHRFDAAHVGGLHILYVDFDISNKHGTLAYLSYSLDRLLPAGRRRSGHGSGLASCGRLGRDPVWNPSAVFVFRRGHECGGRPGGHRRASTCRRAGDFARAPDLEGRRVTYYTKRR